MDPMLLARWIEEARRSNRRGSLRCGTQITARGNQKGGVGKTTQTLGACSTAVKAGRRELVLDMDPQANATMALLGAGYAGPNMYDVLMAGEHGTLSEAIVESAWPGIDVVPAHIALELFDQNGSLTTAEHRLMLAMRGVDLSAYSEVHIDLRPSLGRLTMNGLVASSRVIVVSSAEAWSVDGVPEFLKMIKSVQDSPVLNPELLVAGLIVNAVDSNRSEQEGRYEQILAAYGDLVIGKVPSSASISAMASESKPLQMAKGYNWSRMMGVFELIDRELNEGSE